ncbi:MAG TPA: TonB-dependent receptor [Woeseiaceae bacterium]|nr:TonB-dependent receptor [Woeseiaceae bacterium]
MNAIHVTGFLALLGAGTAVAQQDGAPGAGSPDPEVEEVVVSGTRIAHTGYDAPTPVSVLGGTDIAAAAPENLADFVNTLPSISNSTTAANSTVSLSGGGAGINALNLRSLGVSRTLVLLDGRRSVGSTDSGAIDINTFPQALVQRVEVVNGGASAAYGSDAVSGVVNFILNKDFEGFEFTAEYGETTYGDGENRKFTATAGLSLMDDRLHVLFNAEYSDTPGIPTVPRDWNKTGFFQIDNPYYTPTNGQPERYIGHGIGPSQVTPGGLITSGSLRGTYFGLIDPATGEATVHQLVYGDVSGPWMIGGDWQYTLSNYEGTTSLLPAAEREGYFTRVGFDITPDIELFGQLSFNRNDSRNWYMQPANIGDVTIQADNAFLPQSIRDALAEAGETSFRMGTTNAGMPVSGAHNTREVLRYVLGAIGELELFDEFWTWEAYYQKGVSKPHEELFATWNNERVALATDAVFAPDGSIVCRSTLTDPDNGCVPLNRIGIGGMTQEALDYIFTDGQPARDQEITQEVAALNFSGDLLDMPAGPVSAAFGFEWRKEAIDGYVDPRYNSGWLYGNYQANRGSYTVRELFTEFAIPLTDSLDINLAGRATDYSTSGSVQTWKFGATFSPVDDIKFRGTVSRDIRAANLGELFQAGTSRSNSVIVNGQPDAFFLNISGNPNVKPEIADNWSVGAVFTPDFLPDLSLAVDYYDIRIKDAIGTLHQQQVVDLCYIQNVQQQCDNIITSVVNGVEQIDTILVSPFNFAKHRSRGMDIEASYTVPLDNWFANAGDLSLRGMFTHYIENTVDTGIGLPLKTAGTNGAYAADFGPPSWLYRLSAFYAVDRWAFSVVGRGVSSGRYNDNSFIECSSNCPPSTPEAITINRNHIDGAFYVDTSISYAFDLGRFQDAAEVQFSVYNLLNKDPVLVANGPSGRSTPAFPQVTRDYYDVLGRTFRLSLRLQF